MTPETKSLIIQGTGGLGKTQLAKAILASLGKYFFVDSLDTIKHLFFVDGEALLCDDVTLSDYTIDQVKSLLDISCDRAIRCRHEDGMVPAGNYSHLPHEPPEALLLPYRLPDVRTLQCNRTPHDLG